MNKLTRYSSTFFILISSTILLISCDQDHEPKLVEHTIVHQENGYFMGWPANNGVWIWDDGEIMTGFTRGAYVENEESHNVESPYYNWLSKSADGGHTWETFTPEGFIGVFDPEGMEGDSMLTLMELTEPIDFRNDSFALRMVGNGYLQPEVPEGGFFYRYDRGGNWEGPFAFNGLSDAEELEGLELTPRTDYIVEGENSALLFLSARGHEKYGSDKAFVARTTDGGITFEFLGWIVDPEDPYRAVMPSTVKTSSGTLISAIRRRDMGDNRYCWIDIYTSEDNGVTWEFLSRAGETGPHNGNPPAMIELTDGRLLVAYGNREHNQIRARFSSDQGHTWGPEIILREGKELDIGYPRLAQNKDGNIVTIYYWADSPTSEKYIATTIWNPGNKDWNKPVKF
ncbi:MAG: sialidase family protein [Cyclobacteriaceae bacterium]